MCLLILLFVKLSSCPFKSVAKLNRIFLTQRFLSFGAFGCSSAGSLFQKRLVIEPYLAKEELYLISLCYASVQGVDINFSHSLISLSSEYSFRLFLLHCG